MSKHLRILFISTFLCAFLVACGDAGPSALTSNSGVQLDYQPPFVPVHVSVDHHGSLTVSVGYSIVTPIGVFTAGIYTNPSRYFNVPSTLTVRLDGQDVIYPLDGEDFSVEFESAFYKRVRLEKIGRDIFLELRRASGSSRSEADNEPKIYNAIMCQRDCSVVGPTSVFPEKTQRVYAEWDYSDIPFGSDYERRWSVNGNEWIRYSCSWNGPTSGHDKVVLREPGGLRSGVWQLTITVDGRVLLREQVTIEGNHRYWSPVGTVHKCFE